MQIDPNNRFNMPRPGFVVRIPELFSQSFSAVDVHFSSTCMLLGAHAPKSDWLSFARSHAGFFPSGVSCYIRWVIVGFTRVGLLEASCVQQIYDFNSYSKS